jgi:ABC-2 type transport system permease protein
MNRLLNLLDWEIRRLWRLRSAWIAALGLLAAGALALASGRALTRAQSEAVAGLPGHYAAQMERIAGRFPEGGDAGYVAYYTFFPTNHAVPPLAPLAVGVRDIAPHVLWVRLLGLEGQLYEADLGNPALQALGGFDLAFVVVALAPLALLLLAHDALTRDRAAGRLPLLVAQAGSPVRLLAVRVGLRAGLVGGIVSLLAWAGAGPGAGLGGWLAAAWAVLACWTGLAALVAAVCRSPAASLATALSLWVALVVLAPALVNLALTAARPVPEGLALTVRQRQEIHGGWDRPKDATFESFRTHNPDWVVAPVTGRFAWRWYYAMHQVGDESVAADSQAYRANLRARSALLARWGWLVPPAYGQLLLAGRAGTDLDAHLDYLDRVRAFHAGLRGYFYPMVFATPERVLRPADYADFPRFDATLPPRAPGPSTLPLWLLAAGCGGVAFLVLHRRPLLA